MRIVVYEVSPLWSAGLYTAHAQVQVRDGDRWSWYPSGPEYPIVGRKAVFSVQEWLEILKRREFEWQATSLPNHGVGGG